MLDADKNGHDVDIYESVPVTSCKVETGGLDSGILPSERGECTAVDIKPSVVEAATLCSDVYRLPEKRAQACPGSQ